MKGLLILALALVTLLVAAPAEAQFYQFFVFPPTQPFPAGKILGFRSAQDFVKWQGCNATVVMIDLPVVNAIYSEGRDQIVIFKGLLDFFHNDDEPIAAVLAHEAGHCIQRTHPNWRSYPLLSIKSIEFDAEAHSHMILRTLHRQASRILLDMRLAFAKAMNRDPDLESWTHGSAKSISKWARENDGLGPEWMERQGL